MLRHKSELEKLNYYFWARFLEQINDDNALIRVIDKLELATPKREDLSVYREILRREFEEDTCHASTAARNYKKPYLWIISSHGLL